MKLKHGFYIMIFLCSFIPVFIWVVFSMYASERRIAEIIGSNIEAIGGSQIMTIENFCEGRKEAMETIARMNMVKNAILDFKEEGHSDELDEFLINNEEQKTYIASISVVDMEFNVVGSSQHYKEYQVSDFRYSAEKYKSGVFAMGDVYERMTDTGIKRMIPAYIGVYADEKLIGYLIQEIDCDYFNRLRLQTDFLEDGTLYLLDGKDNIITAGSATEIEGRGELVSTPEEREDYNRAWNAFDHETYSAGTIHYELRNQQYMTYFAKIGYSDWSIRITENMDAQTRSNQSVYVMLVLEGVAIIAILVCVQLLLTKKLIAPFNHIVNTMKEVREKKDYSIRTNISKKDEVGIVAQGIDELLEYIEREELEEKRRQRILEHKGFLSDAMLENMPSGYHRCLPDAEKGFPFLQLGSHFEEILGWTAEEIQNELGNCYRNLIWPEDLDVALTYTDMVTRVGQGNAYDTSVYRMKHKDGGYRWITDATMFVDLGEESFFQGVIADITPYVEGMEEAKKIAEESNRAKTDFLSQMSHDIRTPMNAVIGFTNLAKETDSLEMMKEEYIPRIETASNHLLMIINDVLEMNSIENGKIVFHRTRHDIVDLITGGMTVMQLRAKEKDIKLTQDIRATHRAVLCDENRVNRVFLNLLSNAIKFTPEGGEVMVTVTEKSAANGKVSYEFQVRDTGIGMSPEFVPLVFEPFERERTSTVSRKEGTGLGMAIVKSILDAAGGTISVESKLNVGTTFTICMSFEMAENAPDKITQNPEKTKTSERKTDKEKLREQFEGKRVLLVEDNEFNRMIAETILINAGFVVEVAEDGHLAVEMVQQAATEDYYDVILMDIQMPTMNGYEATKAIRKMDDLRSEVKILAVTANAFESDKQAAKDAGMDGHISKPIDVEVLYNALLEIL